MKIVLLLLMMQSPIMGYYNTVIGIGAGVNLTTGSYNVILGDKIGLDVTTQDCQIRIGKMSPESRKQLLALGPSPYTVPSLQTADKHCGRTKGFSENILNKIMNERPPK